MLLPKAAKKEHSIYKSQKWYNDNCKQYLVKYSQLPTNEFIKLKLMADDIQRDKDQFQDEKVRQENEFKALKIKHLTTVSDKRAVIPRYELEKKAKLTR